MILVGAVQQERTKDITIPSDIYLYSLTDIMRPVTIKLKFKISSSHYLEGLETYDKNTFFVKMIEAPPAKGGILFREIFFATHIARSLMMIWNCYSRQALVGDLFDEHNGALTPL